MKRWTLKEQSQRVEKLSGWMSWLARSAAYADLESRPEELASLSGFDPDPRMRPCEHRLEWYRGRLCLACDNTGWRAATPQERQEKLTFDPYALELPKSGWRPNESEAARRTREAERNDYVLATIARDQRIRAGEEARPDRAISNYLSVAHKPAGYRKVMRALVAFEARYPAWYAVLPREDALLRLALFMHKHVPGRIPTPPTE